MFKLIIRIVFQLKEKLKPLQSSSVAGYGFYGRTKKSLILGTWVYLWLHSYDRTLDLSVLLLSLVVAR